MNTEDGAEGCRTNRAEQAELLVLSYGGRISRADFWTPFPVKPGPPVVHVVHYRIRIRIDINISQVLDSLEGPELLAVAWRSVHSAHSQTAPPLECVAYGARKTLAACRQSSLQIAAVTRSLQHVTLQLIYSPRRTRAVAWACCCSLSAPWRITLGDSFSKGSSLSSQRCVLDCHPTSPLRPAENEGYQWIRGAGDNTTLEPMTQPCHDLSLRNTCEV
jgi:hypothetical protein